MDWREEQAKADRIELLYAADGRGVVIDGVPQHPLHGFYTGLACESPSAKAVAMTAPLTASS